MINIAQWVGIQTAHAANASGAEAQGGFLSVLPLLIIFFVIFYFLLIRPQNKRAKEHKELLTKLAEGDEVATSGGIIGRITRVEEHFLTLQVADKVEILLKKQAVADQLPKGSIEQF